jgi:succinate dehydrogenase hydrophobic anchor subunit
LRDRVSAIATITLVVDLVGSVAIWLFERHQPGTDIRTFGDAIFWVTSQLLTVSSSLQNPIGTGARILDVVLEIYAISVVAALAGSFAAFFHGRSKHRRSVEAKSGSG